MAPIMYAYMDLIPTSIPNFTFIVKHLARTAAILVDPPARDWTPCESSSFRHGSPSNTLGKGADLGLLGYDFAWPMEPMEVDRTFEKTQIIQMSNLTSCGCWLCAQKKRLTCCEKMWVSCPINFWDVIGLQTGCLCKKLRGHSWESSRKVHREVYLPSVTSPKDLHFPCRSRMYKPHPTQNLHTFQSKSSTYHIKVSMFKSSSNTLMIFDVKLQLDAQCRRSEIEFDAVFLYQYLRSWFRMHY